MARSRFWIYAGIILSAGLCAASGWAAYREFVPFAQSSSVMQAKVQALAATQVRPGLSYRSKLLVLTDCNQALSSLEAAAVDPAIRAHLFDNCDLIAGNIAQDMPTFSLAYLVRAVVAQERSDLPAMERALVLSHNSAPYQEWLCLSRAMLAFRHLEAFGPEGQTVVGTDIRVALSSQRGATWLAQRYIFEPDRRAAITAIVEAADPNLQRQFLSAVRREQERAN